MSKVALGKIALKETAKQMALEFCLVPYYSVEYFAQEILNGTSFRFGIQDPNDKISFLKELQLGSSYIMGAYYPFAILDKVTQKQVTLNIVNEEQRKALENYLNSIQHLEPSQPVYQALTSAFSHPTYVRENPVLKNRLIGDAAKTMHHGQEMSQVHYNLYSEALYDAIMRKIKEGSLPNDLDPLTIKNNLELQKQILCNIDLDMLYEETLSKAKSIEEEAQVEAYALMLSKLRTWYEGFDEKGFNVLDENFLLPAKSPLFLSYISTFIEQVEALYVNKKESLVNLTEALKITYDYLTNNGETSHQEYHAFVSAVHGNPSATLRTLGAIMMLMTIAVAILSIIFVPALAVAVGTAFALSGAAATVTAGLIAAGTGTVCLAGTIGFFAAGRQTSLSLTMHNIDKISEDEPSPSPSINN